MKKVYLIPSGIMPALPSPIYQNGDGSVDRATKGGMPPVAYRSSTARWEDAVPTINIYKKRGVSYIYDRLEGYSELIQAKGSR